MSLSSCDRYQSDPVDDEARQTCTVASRDSHAAGAMTVVGRLGGNGWATAKSMTFTQAAAYLPLPFGGADAAGGGERNAVRPGEWVYAVGA